MARGTQHIIYVHGLWMSGGEGVLLRYRLARELGAEVHAFSYSAVQQGMDQISARLAEFVAAIDPPNLHFVGHSLGGLVILQPRFTVGTAVAASTSDITYVATREGWLYLVVMHSALSEWWPA